MSKPKYPVQIAVAPAAAPSATTPPRPLDAALDAVRALAIETLHSARATRFHDAATLCSLGQALVRVFSESVDDFDPNSATACYVNNNGAQMPFALPNRAYRAALQGHDQQDLRNVALGMDDNLRIQAETARAQAAAAASAELKDLLAVRDQLPPDAQATVRTRIRTLVERMEIRNAEPPPAAPAPVFQPLADANRPVVVAPQPPVVRAQQPR
jgi:hypothetical protein